MIRLLSRYKTEALLTLAFWGLVSSLALVAQKSGAPFFTDSPAVSIAMTAKHLWNHGDIRDPRFEELRAELAAGTSGRPGKVGKQDVFAVGRDGELYPKHSLLIAFLSAPVYGLAGDFGLWLLNQTVLFVLLIGVYKLGKRVGSPFPAALVLGTLPLFAGYFLVFSYLPLYDFFPGCCIVWAILLLEKRPWLAGLLLSLAPWVRMSELFLAPFVLLTLGRPSWRHARTYRWAGLGLACGVVPLVCVNAWLWGEPLTGSYMRTVYFKNGEMIFATTAHGFSLSNLANLQYKLFDGGEGLLTRLPIWAVTPLLLAVPPRGRDRWLLGSLLVGACGYFAVMMTYSYWANSSGPRFLFSATALLMVVASYYLHRLMVPAAAPRPAKASAAEMAAKP